ncbi:unnamed protein product [Danaus chrysippus]|uniref:(African queen) hypothetical protein n=1 Tax=Danaus chrysippus TaxID=151541 RepID=A0A8J2QKI7_9NEOP|nr:unnamed protein product [Danaus chrysippus]
MKWAALIIDAAVIQAPFIPAMRFCLAFDGRLGGANDAARGIVAALMSPRYSRLPPSSSRFPVPSDGRRTAEEEN